MRGPEHGSRIAATWATDIPILGWGRYRIVVHHLSRRDRGRQSVRNVQPDKAQQELRPPIPCFLQFSEGVGRGGCFVGRAQLTIGIIG